MESLERTLATLIFFLGWLQKITGLSLQMTEFKHILLKYELDLRIKNVIVQFMQLHIYEYFQHVFISSEKKHK